MTIKGKMPGQVNIDNKVFQLHYRLTTFLFLGFSILSTTSSLVGHPINCFCGDCDGKKISSEVIDTHCWISGTYTLPEKSPEFNRRIGFEMGYHGLGTQQKDEERKYHLYYQWVPFVLFLQGVAFFIPHWMWEINEDGRVSALVHDMRLPMMDKDELKKKIASLTIYVSETLGSYNGYYMRFVLCDFCNILNVLFQMFLTNRFLNSEFQDYGPRCLEYFSDTSKVKVSPLTDVFPKLTKCKFQTYGVSGTVQDIDAVCVLALNILNEKVYLFLWFWMVILTVITIIVFIFRTTLMFIPRFRVPLFQRRAHSVNTDDIKEVVRNIRIGDFFFLSLLAKNLDITAFRMFLAHLSKALKRKRRVAAGFRQISNQISRPDEADPLAPKQQPLHDNNASTMGIVAAHLGV